MQAPDGHRAGLDALLLAACARSEASRVADFGSGSGAVGLAVASRLPSASVTLIEREAGALADARATLAHPLNAGLAARLSLLEADLTARGAAREAAGLADGMFDHVLANPPYNDAAHRVSPNPRRAAAHVADDDTFEVWARTAAATLRPGGRLTVIARPSNLPAILAAWSGRFSGPFLLPVHTRPGAASRLLAHGRLGARDPLALLPALRLGSTGEAASTTDALTSGDAWIDLEGGGAVLKSHADNETDED